MILYMTRRSMSETFREMDDDTLSETIDHAYTVLRWLVYEEGNLKAEPVVYAWSTFESALVVYGQLACMEYAMQRRIHDLRFWDFARVGREMQKDEVFYYETPPWFADTDVLRSHRSLRQRLGLGSWARTPNDLPVLWPVIDEEADPVVYDLKVSKADKAMLAGRRLKLDAATRKRVVNV